MFVGELSLAEIPSALIPQTITLHTLHPIFKENHGPMDRRTFLFFSGIGALASAAPVFLNSRAHSMLTEGVTVAQATGYRAVGQVDQLANGHAIQTQVGNVRLAVIRNPGNPNAIVALNRRCPHDGCQVNWDAAQQSFICPCHSAEFSATGAVTRGPARSGLQHYAARIEGNQVTVQI